MNRRWKVGLAAIVLCCLTAAPLYALSKGVLLSQRVEVHSTNGYRGGRPYVFNTFLVRCRYLTLAGVKLSQPIGPADDTSCSFLAQK